MRTRRRVDLRSGVAIAAALLSVGPFAVLASCRERPKASTTHGSAVSAVSAPSPAPPASLVPATADISVPAPGVPTPVWPSEARYGCIDAVAVELKPHLVERTAPGQGAIRIDGVIQNIGTVAYRSTAPADHLTFGIVCGEPGTWGQAQSRTPSSRALDRLLPGERANVSSLIDWTPAMRRAGCVCTLTIEPIWRRQSAPRDCGTGQKKTRSISADEIDAALGQLELQPFESRLSIVGTPEPKHLSDREHLLDLVVDYDLAAAASRFEVAVSPPFRASGGAPVYVVNRKGRITLPVTIICPADYPANANVVAVVSSYSHGEKPDATARLEMPAIRVCVKP